MTLDQFGHLLNSILWIIGNLTILGIFVSALLFGIGYPLLFDIKVASGGQRIWEAIGSVAGIGFLIVIGLFVDGRAEWWVLPDGTAWWRPLLRVVVFGWVAYTFGRLLAHLLVRRFAPNRVKKKAEDFPENTLGLRPRDLHRKR